MIRYTYCYNISTCYNIWRYVKIKWTISIFISAYWSSIYEYFRCHIYTIKVYIHLFAYLFTSNFKCCSIYSITTRKPTRFIFRTSLRYIERIIYRPVMRYIYSCPIRIIIIFSTITSIKFFCRYISNLVKFPRLLSQIYFVCIIDYSRRCSFTMYYYISNRFVYSYCVSFNIIRRWCYVFTSHSNCN